MKKLIFETYVITFIEFCLFNNHHLSSWIGEFPYELNMLVLLHMDMSSKAKDPQEVWFLPMPAFMGGHTAQRESQTAINDVGTSIELSPRLAQKAYQ